ncbi:hypothetical protein BDV25DRAFT_120679 [Aspergillus avenaceus]|uniref:Uncharacterized protein n=1 Tax=Aspergillus avenaceus TaxID=36643 RepID=A0A5N6TTY1_ASPAV|nr:hypothetical protein BDV25DRAFT_120679 [Aspergillus avenaceus]
MSSDLRVGWAVRRPNNCDDNEDGHNTWGKWYTCCPLEMQKFVDADNNAGCTVGGEPREVPKQCAGNSTLVLWSDPYGYFCCDPDRIGFANENHYKGCATTDEYNAGLRNESMTKVFREGTSSGKKPPLLSRNHESRGPE